MDRTKRKGQNDIFTEEQQILDKAKDMLEHAGDSEHDLKPLFSEMVVQYEKLLKTSMKLARISDIQGRTLKEREYEIQVANQSLEKLERMRRDLITDISHELGTPLSTLQGYIEALIDGVIQPEERYFRMMQNKVLLINQLINDLFELAKLKANRVAFNMKQVTVQEFITPLAMKYAPEMERRSMKFVIQDKAADFSLEAYVQADLIRIEQVLSNFLMNAVKYTPSSGRIRVETEIEPAALAVAGGKVDDLQLKVRICDTGKGIHEDDLPYVFDRFYRGTNPEGKKVEGSGLGLAITREIIEQHGGTVGVSSQIGVGSTFYFTLPIELGHKPRHKEDATLDRKRTH